MKVLLIVILAVVGFFTLPWLLLAGGLFMLPNPATPAMKYAEFPFRLEYEIHGKRKVLEDKIICQYDGIGCNEGQGKFRKWKARYASGKDVITLEISSNTRICFHTGSAEYLMADSNSYSFPPLAELYNTVKSRVYRKTLSYEEVEKRLAEHHITIIRWDRPQPIKNQHF